MLVVGTREESIAGLLGLALVRARVSTPAHFDVDVRGLVLVEEVVELVVGALHRVQLLLAVSRCCLVQAVRLVMHAGVLIVPDVWRRLLVALVVAEGHGHLVHVEGPVQVVEAILLEVVIQEGTGPSSTWPACAIDVQVHFHVGVTAVVDSAQVSVTVGHVVRKERALVQVAPLVHALLCRRVELHHHGRVHLGAGGVQGHGVDVVEGRHACRGGSLAADLEHVLLVLAIALASIAHVLMERDVLEVIVVLLLAAESELGALVKVVGVALPRDVHHNEVLA